MLLMEQGCTLQAEPAKSPLSRSTNTLTNVKIQNSNAHSGKSDANSYLSVSLSSSPPLHQEAVALGEAWGRHSRTASPPL